MPVYPSIRDHAVERLERAGYAVQRPSDGPPAIARAAAGSDAARGGHPFDEDRPIAVEPLSASTVDPETTVPKLQTALRNDRNVLFVAPERESAAAVADFFRSPTAVASEDDRGRRTFVHGSDRVPTDDGRYACATVPPEDLTWREVVGREDEGRTGTDDPDLALVGPAGRLTTLSGVDALDCPPAAAFEYAYHRDPDEKWFVVSEGDREVGTFAGVDAMRSRGFHPIPMPIVPEHVFEERVGGRWAVVGAADGAPVLTVDGETTLD